MKRKSQARAARLQNKTCGSRQQLADARLMRDFRLVAAALRVWEAKQKLA